jgi:hypothetical protein
MFTELYSKLNDLDTEDVHYHGVSGDLFKKKVEGNKFFFLETKASNFSRKSETNNVEIFTADRIPEHWNENVIAVWDVILLDESRINIDFGCNFYGCNFYADKIQVNNRREIFSDTSLVMNILKYTGKFIEVIPNPTDEMKLAAVKSDGMNIGLIIEPSPDLIIEALKSNGLAIQLVYNPTKEMKMIAVKQNWEALGYVKNRTAEMCVEAIKGNKDAIKLINNPTDEMKKLAGIPI